MSRSGTVRVSPSPPSLPPETDTLQRIRLVASCGINEPGREFSWSAVILLKSLYELLGECCSGLFIGYCCMCHV